MEKAIGLSLLRTITHPMYQAIQASRGGKPIKERWASPLYRLTKRYNSQGRLPAGEPETRKPYAIPPWWKPPDTWIDEDPEKAIATHDRVIQETNSLNIYTDGSGINGKIGAAAVVPTRKIIEKAYMGTEEISTVYAGELQGIRMGLDIARRERAIRPIRRINIFTDNQASIQSTESPGTQSG